MERSRASPGHATEWWRIASHRSAKIGDRTYLFKQGDDPRGIFGIGTIIGGPEFGTGSADEDGAKPHVLVQFESLIDPTEGFLLRLDEIGDVVPQSLITAQASGIRVPNDVDLEKEDCPLDRSGGIIDRSQPGRRPGF